MINKKYLLAAALSWALVACTEAPPEDHSHADDTGAAAHAHPEEGAGLVYTDYTEATELFVEFPPLVAGEPSAFAAHVTRLSDYQPLTSGTLDVILESGGRPVARFRVNNPARPGIFMPQVTPRDSGTFDLAIEVIDGATRARHELGAVSVFPNAGAVVIQQAEPEGEISYLKEQQWSAPFGTQIVKTRPLRPSVPGFATVQAPADGGAEIRAPTDGYFATAGLVSAGDSVAAGDVMGRLIPRLGDSTDVGNLTVALERARSQMTLAEQEVKRLQGLFEQGAVPERRFIEAQQAQEVARAELSAARARLEQYQGGDSEAGIALRSPVAGEVIAMNAGPGAFVRAGERVFRIATPERRWLEVRVPERFARDLHNASGVWFEREAGETAVLDAMGEARIVRTETAIDPVTRTAGVTIEYPSQQGPELIGQRFAAHVFTAAPEPRLAIPRSAVIDDGGRRVVYVQTDGELFARRPVELGIIDGGFVEVVSGISQGDRVVSEGAYYVKLAAAGGEEIGHGHAH